MSSVAGWPSSKSDALFTTLVDALTARVETTTDLVERGKLERLRDGLVDLGRDAFRTAVGAATDAVIRSQM